VVLQIDCVVIIFLYLLIAWLYKLFKNHHSFGSVQYQTIFILLVEFHIFIAPFSL